MKFLNNDYSFRGLGPTKDDPEYLENAEYIDFAGFNSSDYDWWLIDRDNVTYIILCPVGRRGKGASDCLGTIPRTHSLQMAEQGKRSRSA